MTERSAELSGAVSGLDTASASSNAAEYCFESGSQSILIESRLLCAALVRHTTPVSTVILSRAVVGLSGVLSSNLKSSRSEDSSGPTSRWRVVWPMGKARDKAWKNGKGGRPGGKAKDGSDKPWLKKEQQRGSSCFRSDADDREFEAQVKITHSCVFPINHHISHQHQQS